MTNSSPWACPFTMGSCRIFQCRSPGIQQYSVRSVQPFRNSYQIFGNRKRLLYGARARADARESKYGHLVKTAWLVFREGTFDPLPCSLMVRGTEILRMQEEIRIDERQRWKTLGLFQELFDIVVAQVRLESEGLGFDRERS
jgi:hypothetical protein